MQRKDKLGKLWWLIKALAVVVGVAIAFFTGALLTIAAVATVGYVAWQAMKGAPWDRASMLPAGLWGGGYAAYEGVTSQTNVLDIGVNIVGLAIGGMLSIWLIRWAITRVMR